jgi:hypothetical protein
MTHTRCENKWEQNIGVTRGEQCLKCSEQNERALILDRLAQADLEVELDPKSGAHE